MKTTVKIDTNSSISVEPMKYADGVFCEFKQNGAVTFFCLSQDAVGALMFGLETTLDAIDLKSRQVINPMHKQASGVRCHGDACAAGQLACPTPAACGVAS
jgi:hypothetical protein